MADPLFSPKDYNINELANMATGPDAVLIVKNWQQGIVNGKVLSQKEEQLQDSFLTAFFGKLLDYPYEKHLQDTMLSNEQKTRADATKPDGALGYYTLQNGIKEEDTRAVIELKDATVNLDKKQNRPDFKGSPVEQAFAYVPKMGGKCKWVIVSNFLEIRLYHASDSTKYEQFIILDLLKGNNLQKLMYLMQRGRLFHKEGSNAATDLLFEKRQERQKTISNQFYKEYKVKRESLFYDIRNHNKAHNPTILFHATQKLIDRLIFTCFVKDLQIVGDVLKTVRIQPEISFSKRNDIIWKELRNLFAAMDAGFPKKSIPPFNGGLFAFDEVLDNLEIHDDQLADLIDFTTKYDFQSDLDVNILGHIFEQSISDIEEILVRIQAETPLAAAATGLEQVTAPATSKRKKDGIFYTPAYITRYIVAQSIGAWLDDRSHEILQGLGMETLTAPTAEDYKTIENNKKSINHNETIQKHRDYWQQYGDALQRIRVLDPACGSGAFLTQALDYLFEEWKILKTEEEKLTTTWDETLKQNASEAANTGGLTLSTQTWDPWPVKKRIITENIFGVDINPASVEITKLSLWLKTANRKGSLASLQDNIRLGNSLIDDPAVAGDLAFDWNQEFKTIMDVGGFDVVIGNPPYVRQELLGGIKKHLSENFAVFHSSTDLFAYFYEKGITSLKPDGYLGFISNTFEKTSSGLDLRRYLQSKLKFIKYIDFTEKQIFEGATTYPVIIIAKTEPQNLSSSTFKYVKIPRNAENSGFDINNFEPKIIIQESLFEYSWSFNTEDSNTILKKLKDHPKLRDVYGKTYYGIKTGLNEAFMINSTERNKIISTSPEDSKLIKPFYEGKDIEKWHTPVNNKWLICVPKGFTIKRNLPNLKSENVSEPPPRYGDMPYDDAWDWFKRNYNGIATYLLPFKDAAEARSDKGDYWWELRACDYYQHFESPKIIWPNLQNSNKFCFDEKGYYITNPSIILPVADKSLLTVLNSKVVWYFLNSICTVRNGGYIEVQPQYVEQIPVPALNKKQTTKLTASADIMLSGNARLQEISQQFLEMLQAEFKIEKSSGKLNHWYMLDWQGFRTEIQKSKPEITMSGKTEENWHERFHRKQAEANAIRKTLDDTNKEIDQMVFALYGLTDAEIKIVEGKG